MRNFKAAVVAIFLVVVAVAGIMIYGLTHETIQAGYVGYRYDRTIKNGDERAIPGTSVLDEALTGRVTVNPFTQEILTYPTTIVARNWTCLEEGDNKSDMSMQIGSQEGKNVGADIYISVRPLNMSKIISSFGLKKFDSIVDNDIYGLVKGKLSIVAQAYSIYDIQASRSKIQEEAFNLLAGTLSETYGIELVRFEIGTLILPTDIQQKIDQKTEAINAVELAKLDREKQDEINQKIVDEQKAESEKELLKRQSEADAAAYEQERAAEAALKVAEMAVKEAELLRQAELLKQDSFTEAYFRNRELDVQLAAVKAINNSVKTIVTDGSGEGYGALFGLKEILGTFD